MARSTGENLRAGAMASRAAKSDEVRVGSVRAYADGFASLAYAQTGSYYDLTSDGIENPTDTVVWSDVAPGNSYNETHYATDEGVGAEFSEASSEVAAAYFRLEGEIREGVDYTSTWTRPDGVVAWEGSNSIPDPSTQDCDGSPCDYWEWVWVAAFIGRDFGQAGTAEIIGPGVYTVEVDSNYGTWSRSVELVGPEAIDCTIPSEVVGGGTATAEVTVANTPEASYTGTLVATIPMTEDRTEREPLTLGATPFSIAAGETAVYEVPIVASEIGSPTVSTDVEIYCVTNSLNAPLTDGEPFFEGGNSTDDSNDDGGWFFS